jgi:putative nucleotidyltransferase with HDIG domain
VTPASNRRRAPRLVVKILGFSFAVIVGVLATVFLAVSWQTRERLTRAVVANMESSQRRFADLAVRRQREQRLQAIALAENPTLKAAVDTYHAEDGDPAVRQQLANTIGDELTKLQRLLGVAALSVTDIRGVILASVGPQAASWVPGDRVPARVDAAAEPVEAVIARGPQAFLTTVVPLMLVDDLIGEFFLASPLDDAYARQLAAEAGADVVIMVEGRVVAGTAPRTVAQALERAVLPAASASVTLDGEAFVVGRLWAVDAVTVYAVDSVSAAIHAATAEALRVLLVIGLGALLLAALASWWLARILAAPIDGLTQTLAQMTREHDLERPVAASGASRELDDLVETFDALRAALVQAEAESEAAYVGVIGSLAAALDARDPYTAGHSERVANLSVAVARQMDLSDLDVETVRLGALLHDIGKIGVNDAVLRKPSPLSDEEFAHIKLHPGLGARILRPLRFLSAHLPIVELHHEQPNGRGYPHGLVGAQIPLLASIVHVADAFDAITSARAYRPSRPAADAMAELRKHAGTQFDVDVVAALEALPAAVLLRSQEAAAGASMGDEGASVRGALVQFRARAHTLARASALARTRSAAGGVR